MTEQTFFLENINPLELFGVNDTRLRQIEKGFPELKFIVRGDELKVVGDDVERMARLKEVMTSIFEEIRKRGKISENRFQEILTPDEREVKLVHQNGHGGDHEVLVYGSNGNLIKPKTVGQRELVAAVNQYDVVFAVGPAGTGKTYVAVALAVRALKEKRVKKIILSRPAVDAGESLGFLPGDMKEKVDPYLRPMYDALEDMLHSEKLKFYLAQNIIEIAPLAFMRGRTLANAFIILDEAQNTSEMQMKMFLTRLGENSKMIITGDDTQIDLPTKIRSGLIQATRILKNAAGIKMIRMRASDVVRHKVVKEILAAYEQVDKDKEKMFNENGKANEEQTPAKEEIQA
ncbi:MAG: PhoH family protein [Bacteroidia bacterium]